ncbi:MAG: ribonuclease Z [Spirochaetaceae bacterium]|nr:ribonuclease Z [Spirochaetaceae bacterium]
MRVEKLGGNKLELTNSGDLSIFFVGSGSAFTKKMNQTNILIVKGDDHLMVDCGTKTPQALWEYGLPVFKLNNFFITHTHADHIGGLEEVMLMNRYVMNQKKANIYITKKFRKNLWNYSLKGGAEGNENHKGKQLTFHDMWNPIVPKRLKGLKRDAWQFSVGSLKITTFRTMHTPDTSKSWKDSAWSNGLIIDDKILFTSDTRFDPEMLDFCLQNWDIETIFHDCQFFEGGVHASLNELDSLSDEIKEKTYLMHYGDNWKDFKERVKDSPFAGLVKEGHFYNFSL